MRIQTYGHDIEVTPALRDYVENKLERLGRHVERPLEVRVQLSLDKPNHKAEATLVPAGGKAMHADATGVDMYAAIDLLVDKLDRQLLKQHKKQTDHHRGANPARDGSFG